MTWPDIFLICFATGFALSLVSFIAGSLHLPHFHIHLGQGGAPIGHGPVGHGPAGHGAGSGKASASPLNLGTLAAFLTWFGGAGYLLMHVYDWALVAAIVLAALAGLTAASLIFLFLARVLMANDRALDPADYDMIGVLGRVSSTLREGGTGEMIFSQQGRRRGVAIRSEDDRCITKGKEVVVTRFEKGIAYVREWDEMAGIE